MQVTKKLFPTKGYGLDSANFSADSSLCDNLLAKHCANIQDLRRRLHCLSTTP
jgi:hypothetical protein